MKASRQLSTGEASDETGFSQSTLRRMIDDGRLPATMVGGRFVIKAGDLAALEDELAEEDEEEEDFDDEDDDEDDLDDDE